MNIPVGDEEVKEEEKKEQETETVEEQVTEEHKTEEKNTLADEYLNLARVIQADFDNYRKRSLVQIENAKTDAIANTVEILLPCLDAFKKAKENIKDEKILEGITMLEKSVLAGFEKLGVKKIESIGLPLDPNVHNVLAVAKDESKPDDTVLDEFQAGYKLDNKIIRCAQVLVNKL